MGLQKIQRTWLWNSEYAEQTRRAPICPKKTNNSSTNTHKEIKQKGCHIFVVHPETSEYNMAKLDKHWT
jgi:hypothetical protein